MLDIRHRHPNAVLPTVNADPLKGANLEGASLEGANLTRANLSSANEETERQLSLIRTALAHGIQPREIPTHQDTP